MSKKWNAKRREMVDAFARQGLIRSDVIRSEIAYAAESIDAAFPQWVYDYSTGHNRFDLSPLQDIEGGASSMVADVVPLRKPNMTHQTEQNFVPSRTEGYEEFGNFSDVYKILQTGIFYPTYVTGLSGNGKTLMIEEICARLGRELIRVNITAETDESDLIGGFRIQNGTTIWEDGPAVVAMKRGAVLLLDEVDLGTPKMLCLQPILEGSGIFVKKIQQYIRPSEGFTVLATANTKGRGNSNGMFIGTQIMNEAFLERFAVTFEQEYPPKQVEEKILKNILERHNSTDDAFVECLTEWSEKTRKAYDDGSIEAVISTRRLVHIINSFVIFKDRIKAVKLGLNRFDEDLKKSFFDYYSKIDEEVSKRIAAEKKRKNKVKTETQTADTNQSTDITMEPIDTSTATSIDPLAAMKAAVDKVNKMAV